ncbi:pentapeptide repeat-containing protein [Microcoleus sp. CAWBG58]|uniref:pentapeptide repeat-containing protein n=1 Tax=Microcoleus sp. CAWBG58 TaxID=2841651 RepID=UPI0025D0775F|nr:pentapeptide repeat-containing protein [Microcoleus sp. CAWBG58]
MSSLILQNFRNQNLQGRSFKGRDLTNTDFSGADIRGADFTNANLEGANFKNATAGLTPRRVLIVVIIAASLSGIGGAASVFTAEIVGSSLISIYNREFIIILFLVMAFLWVAIVSQGILKALGYSAIAVAVLIALISILGGISDDGHPILSWMRNFRVGWVMDAFNGKFKAEGNSIPYLITDLFQTTAGIMTVVIPLSLAIALAKVVGGNKLAGLVIFEAVATSGLATFFTIRNSTRSLKEQLLVKAGIVNTNNQCSRSDFNDFVADWCYKFADPPLVIAIITATVILALAWVGLGIYVARRVLAEDDKYALIRQLAVIIGGIGGTSFRDAKLANTNFTEAILKNTDFRFATIYRTLWRHAKSIEWARVDETILINPAVRDLLVTGNGYQKSYQGMDLRGANLIGAHLNYAKMQTADLSQATLEAANLEYAILTQVQAIGTDFSSAKMTGVCGLGTWNIDSTTKLEWVDCKWVYLLEEPKPRTDDRERRPSSGEYKPGEFTSFFQQVVNTVDFIFDRGVDWKAFAKSLHQVQVENQDIELKIQSIENKGNGIVVKVSVPPDADKAKIHQDFNLFYEEMLQLMGVETPALQNSAEQRQYLMSVMEEMVRPLSEQVVFLRFDRGDLEQGFKVTSQIWCDRHRYPIILTSNLPPKPELTQRYQQWQEMYKSQIINQNSRIKINKAQITNFSKQELKNLATEVENDVQDWLRSPDFSQVEQALHDNLKYDGELRIIVQTEDNLLRKLPWHRWEFFKNYSQAEVALSRRECNRVKKSFPSRNKVRILAILGDCTGINVDKDRQVLENLSEAETVFLVKPTYEKLEEYLADETGWDILCFSGHSQSEVDGNTGVIYINETDKLTVGQLKHSLKIAIERGLEIAIFNSCDGLGLGKQLADLDIPQIIVMREPVPDAIAQEFLKVFLQAFAGGNSFYTSVRKARERLKKSWDEKIPGASWLPVICQNQAESPKTWQELLRK